MFLLLSHKTFNYEKKRALCIYVCIYIHVDGDKTVLYNVGICCE